MSMLSKENSKLSSFDFNKSLIIDNFTQKASLVTFQYKYLDKLKIENSDIDVMIYTVILILFILIGFIVNLIVILTYKFGDRNILNRNHLVNFKQNESKAINSLKGAELVNSNNNNNNNQIGFENKNRSKHFLKNRRDERRLTIAVGNGIKLTSINPTLDHSNEIKKSLSNNTNLNKSFKKASVLSTIGSYGRLSFNSNTIRRTLSSYFILSLGCCDFFICIFNISFILVLQSGLLKDFIDTLSLNSSFSLDIMCKFANFFIQIPISLEIEILLTIAIDRYFSVFRPIKLYYFDRKKLKTILIFLIFSSAIICMPNIFFYKSVSNNDLIYITNFTLNQNFRNRIYSLSKYCVVQETYSHFYNYYQLILFLLFFTNLIIISVCYLKVYSHVYKASLNQRKETISSLSNIIANTNNTSNSRLSSSKLSSSNIRNTTNRVDNNNEIKDIKNCLEFKNNDQLSNKFSTIKTAKFELSEVEENDEIINNKVNDLAQEFENDNSMTKKSEKIVSKVNQVLNPNNNQSCSYDESLNNNKISNHVTRTNNDNSPPKISRSSFFFAPRRLRYLSESHTHQNLIKQHSFPSENGSNRSNSLNEFNRLTIRRHTSRKFKHGKTARVLGIATFVLALTWLPYWFSIFMSIFKNEKNIKTLNNNQIWEIFFKHSFYLNYIVNPIIYSFVDQRFRKNVVRLFKQTYSFLLKRPKENIDIDSSPSHYPVYRSINSDVLDKKRNIISIADFKERNKNLECLLLSSNKNKFAQISLN